MPNQTDLNQISHENFNGEISNQTNLNQMSHKTFNSEIFNQANLNQISHKTLNIIYPIRPTKIKYLIERSTVRYLIRPT